MTSNKNKVTGGCLCGAIRYESDQPPYEAGYCHCRTCQKGLGNLFGAWVFIKHSDFRFISGEPAWYESSETAKRGFCMNCGSPIAFQSKRADHVAIWLGTLDDPVSFEPQAHWWTTTKIPWVDIHAKLPEKGPIS
jgi:hypothetical protein